MSENTNEPDASGPEHLSADEAEALGLDSTGRDGDPNFPFRLDALTAEQRLVVETMREASSIRAWIARGRELSDRLEAIQREYDAWLTERDLLGEGVGDSDLAHGVESATSDIYRFTHDPYVPEEVTG